jgi:hypothetical protein
LPGLVGIEDRRGRKGRRGFVEMSPERIFGLAIVQDSRFGIEI